MRAPDRLSGLLGATGPRTGERVRALARRSGLTTVGSDGLTLVAPVAGLVTARDGDRTLWLVGTLDGPYLSQSRLAALARTGPGEASPEPLIAGQFLLVAHDVARRTIRVRRDPLGARTLHHARSGAEVVFAEHLVDLLAALPVTPAPDRAAVVRWITTRSLTPGRTLFTGVARLSAGEELTISGGQARAVQRWRPRFREPERLTDAEAGARVAGAALAAVARATGGARRPAVRLSGGLDSACVAAGLAAAAPGRGLALARTFPGYPQVDESALIAETAAVTGLALIDLPYVETALPGPVRDHADRWALPAPSPNLAIHPPLLAAARAEGVDRLLDGEGGDEMFGTWPALIADVLWAGDPWAAWELVGRLPRIGRTPGRRHRAALLLDHGVRGGLPDPLRRTLRQGDLLHSIRSQRLVRPRDALHLAAELATDPWATLDGPHWWRSAVATLIGDRDRLDASGTLARVAADGRIDARHPFLHDVALLETMLATDPRAAFRGVADRAPLRDGLAGRIPDSVRTRYAKSVFNEISTQRLDGDDGAWWRARLAEPGTPVREFVDPRGLRALLDPAPTDASRHRRAGTIFRIAAVDEWLRVLDPHAF